MTSHIFQRSLTFFLIDDLGVEDFSIECHHDEFLTVLEQAIAGLGEENAPRTYRLSRIARDD